MFVTRKICHKSHAAGATFTLLRSIRKSCTFTLLYFELLTIDYFYFPYLADWSSFFYFYFEVYFVLSLKPHNPTANINFVLSEKGKHISFSIRLFSISFRFNKR